MQIRSLHIRIIVFFMILLFTVQGVLYFVVTASGQRIAERTIGDELAIGERVFRRLVDQRSGQLAAAAQVLAADFGFRTAVATSDAETIASALANHGNRIQANVVMLASLDGSLTAAVGAEGMRGMHFPLPALLEVAREKGKAAAIVLLEGRPYQIVMVPVLAPVPIAWVAMGFTLDDRVASDLQSVSTLHVSFLSRAADGRWSLHASTLPAPMRASLLGHSAALADISRATTMGLDGEDYQSLLPILGETPEGRVVALLQRSRREALAPFDQVRTILTVLALVSIGLSVVGSVMIARGISRPVQRLADAARQIRDGDYAHKVEVENRDEIGELATSFNHMLDGIAARESEILRLAYEDTLTGLPNRARLRERLAEALDTARGAGAHVAVMMLDLDRFKLINDSLGHPAGDQVLRLVAARLQTTLRDTDMVARLGGDEFAIVLPDGSAERVQRVAQRILGELEAPIPLDGQAVDVSASIGVACHPEHGDDPDVLMRHADVAMYAAKRGNTGWAAYDPQRESGRMTHLSLLGELRHAIEHDELSLYYQPKLDLVTGQVRRAEALVRWIHPERGFVSPGEFVPFAEQTGAIKQLTRWVLARGIRQVADWRAAGLDIAVSINVSTRDLMSPDLTEYVSDQLARQGTPPDRVCLEITESGFMEDPTHALATLERLHGLGLMLSVDDFGTGYSSLAYLKKLPVSELKIDQSFVRDMVTNEDDATIVRSTIELGHNMGLEVTAEGVEDGAGLEMLRDLGCDQAQGYFIAKPMPAPQFEDWLRARAPEREVPEPADAQQPPRLTVVPLRPDGPAQRGDRARR